MMLEIRLFISALEMNKKKQIRFLKLSHQAFVQDVLMLTMLCFIGLMLSLGQLKILLLNLIFPIQWLRELNSTHVRKFVMLLLT